MNEWEWVTSLGVKCFDPMDLFILRDTVKQGDNYFHTEDGRRFNLDYMPDRETVRFNPERGFVPMGFLRISDLLREDV
jgi:hypothetical protein